MSALSLHATPADTGTAVTGCAWLKRPAKPRTAFAGFSAVSVLAVLAKFTVGDLRSNLLTGFALWLLAVVLGLRFNMGWLRDSRRPIVGLAVVLFGVFAAAWQWQVSDLWLNGQLALYSGAVVAFIAAVAWFRQSGAGTGVIRLLFELKLGAVIAASLMLFVLVVNAPADPGAIGEIVFGTPVYGHIRHFNNDQLPAIAAALFLMSTSANTRSKAAWFILLAFMGYLLAWSGGRGVMLSIGVFGLLVGSFRIFSGRTLLVCCTALAVGALLVILSGRGDDMLFGKIVNLAGNADQLTSLRMGYWLGALGVWRESWLSIVFGFGPDAILNTVGAQIGNPPIFQVHNGPIQVLIEFGLIGLAVFTTACVFLVRRIIWFLQNPLAPQAARVSAALLAALGCYMLVTGIIYHAIPLSFVTFLSAYLFHFDLEALQKANQIMPVSADPSAAGPKTRS